jgi:hypothetical protein
MLMAIPDIESLMRPLLALASDGKEHSLEEARENLAKELVLTKNELNTSSPKGMPVFKNRVAWAKVHLQGAGLFDSPRKGFVKISDRGREVLTNGPKQITIKYLQQFPEYLVAFRSKRNKQEELEPSVAPDEKGQTSEAVDPMRGSVFTWVPIYIELAKKILPHRDHQAELINALNELKAQGLPIISSDDYDEQENEIPLGVIDPFTFFACFNTGITNENRRSILAYLKTKFELKSDVPADFDGLPTVFIQNARFFPYAKDRKADDIPSLWSLAEAVVNDPPEKLDPLLFERCLQIKTVGIPKLTMGMFWLNPKDYIAWDAKNRKLFEQEGINVEVEDLATYLQLIRNVNAKLGTDYPRISQTAFGLKPDKQYWAGGFQWGNTSKLDEFLQGNFWQIGWKRKDTRPAAKKTWANFERINVGDEFAIKGYGHRNVLRVRYIGEVVSKTEDGVLKLRKIDRPLYRDKGPKGLKGASWFDTLVPIKSKSIIDAIFHIEQPRIEPRKELRAMNLILFGPPGTGKTYQSIEWAVKFINPGLSAENHITLKRKYDELVHQGRIEFITFHQSYSYEDFVEGIRPIMDPDEEDDVPRYECRPGVFKRLAVSALFDCLKGTSTPKQPSEEDKSEIVQLFLDEDEESGYHLKPESEWNQYVLVIDEINRGNISKIFGELISLIEPDKRLRAGDQQNTLIVTLPYSGEKFAVPANLRLLATMNTADKSIALVDVALRRRFDFEEIGVEMKICKGLTPGMLAALNELNRRIVLRKDRDHQIGHAYFVQVSDELSFNQRFRNQIIPLLQEYFYNDWEGLRYVLGENSNSDGSFIRKLSGADDREARTKWHWYFDAGTSSLNCLQALSNNYKPQSA